MLARDIQEMVTAYRHDGISFFKAGDRVNSLAGCWYALGWLDTGCCLGLLNTPHFNRTWPDVTGSLDKDNRERLDEKTGRYENMLDRQFCQSISPPEQNTDAYLIADRLLVVARFYHSWGAYSINRKDSGFPLACFSYGYGWLDCGVRTGFFSGFFVHETFLRYKRYGSRTLFPAVSGKQHLITCSLKKSQNRKKIPVLL